MPSSRRPTSVPSSLYRYAGVGAQFAATIAVFAAAGWWLDTRLGSSPWLLLVGVFAGFALGLYSMVSKFSPHPPAEGREADEGPTSEPPA